MADSTEHALGKFAREKIARAVLESPQLLALLACAAEAAGLEIPTEPGPDFEFGLEIDAARVLVRRRTDEGREAAAPEAPPAP